MLNLFKTKPLLLEEDREFQHACYAWLLKHFGGVHFYKETQLVLPSRDFFPSQVDSAEEAVQETFAQVKKLAGMDEWPCTLVPQEEDPNLVVAPTVVVQNAEQNPLGTFSASESNEVTITYNPRLVTDPVQMVATFAHELSHYLTGTATEAPPEGGGTTGNLPLISARPSWALGFLLQIRHSPSSSTRLLIRKAGNPREVVI